MLRTRLMAALTLAALLMGVLAASVDAATLAAWKAPLGSSGYNGYATVVNSAAGTGTLRVVAKRLSRQVSYPVEVRSGSCTGTRLFALSSVVSSSTGTIVRSYPLTAGRANQVAVTSKLYIRIGTSARARCGRFAPIVPTGAVSGVTVQVPAGAYGGALHLLTVQAVEPWTPSPDSFWQPAPGNVFVTALVRIDAKGSMTYNPYDYRVRDSAVLEYGHVIGREPALHSGDVTNGTSVAGWVTFEVPAREAASLTLVYNSTFGITVLVRLTQLTSVSPSPTPTP